MQYFCDFPAFSIPSQIFSTKRDHFAQAAHIALAFCFLFWAYPALGEENGEDVLNNSITATRQLKTIECNMRVDVFVDGIEFSARGRYEEQAIPNAPGEFQRSMYRLDLNFQMAPSSAPGSEPNRLTIVCHASPEREKGRLWRYQSIEGEKKLSFIKLFDLENAVNRSNQKGIFPSSSETRNLGGLNGMLRQIKQFYDFSENALQTVTEDMEKVPVWIVRGTIKEAHFETLLKSLGGIDKKKRYPSDLPSDIEIHIGKNDLFPYKIRYMNRKTAESIPKGVLSETTYFDIILNGEPIPEINFSTFDKGELPEGVFNFEDRTQAFIRSIGLR